MKALKPVACDVFIRDENGKLQVNKNSNDWIEYADWQARHKFLMTALVLLKKVDIKPLIDQSQHSHLSITWEKNGREVDKNRLLSALAPIGHPRASGEVQGGGNGQEMGEDYLRDKPFDSGGIDKREV